MTTLTKPRKRIIAIGRCRHGGTFRVTTQAPADWPDAAEIERICANVKHFCAQVEDAPLSDEPGYSESTQPHLW